MFFLTPVIYSKTHCHFLVNEQPKKKVVVIGNGFAGTSFIKKINNPIYDITVVSSDPCCTFTPLIPYKSIKNNKSIITKDIQDIKKDITYIKSNVVDIDLQNKKIITHDNESINYDYIVFAHGVENNTYNIDGIKENCFIVNKTNMNSIYTKIQSLKDNANIAVIGCGPTGSEMIGHLLDLNKFKITAIDALPRPLFNYSFESSFYTRDHWKNNNVKMYFTNLVQSINPTTIIINLINKNTNTKQMNYIQYDMAIWCGGYKETVLTTLLKDKLKHTCYSGLEIDNFMQVKGDPSLYAIGDCTSTDNPQTAQVAVQQGNYLANNFNTNFEYVTPFKYDHQGNVCYIGKYNSIYENDKYTVNGIFGYMLNNCINLYNYVKVL